MKVGYVTTYDPHDVTNWSGTGVYVSRALTCAGLELNYVGPLKFEEPLRVKLRRLAHTKLLQQSYDPERHSAVAKNYARQVDQKLRASDARCALSLGATPIAFCDSKHPIAVWTDATFAGLVDLYPGYRNASRETLRHGNAVEQVAFDRCSAAVFTSDWAAQSALANYEVDPNKVHVVPFGPNRAAETTPGEVEAFIAQRPAAPCRLLFLGVDWERKGGPLALEVAKNLVQRGVATELHVAGCEPPLGDTPPFVIRHGFINKQSPDGAAEIDRLLAGAHFLLLPSRAECFGLVYVEASSVGVPSLAAEVGGVPTAVRNGRNGQLFALSASAAEYADYIADVMADPERYQRLARSSYAEYSAELTWDGAATKMRGILESMSR